MRAVCGAALTLMLLSPAVHAQSSGSGFGDLPDRVQVDAGYFRLSPTTTLRFNSQGGALGDIDFEKDLGLEQNANTFWVDGTWRVARRHQLKLGFTQLTRSSQNYALQRDLTWGGETYNAGLTANAENGADLLGGYYRFAIVRNDRFEIGPALGVGYLWLDARIRATGSITRPDGSVTSRSLDESASSGAITGALGGYVNGWLTPRLVVRGDFLYIKVKPENKEQSVTDWRLGGYYYFTRHAGVAVQYKYNKYRQDVQALSSELGGHITYEGVQVFASFLF